jgi:hypothetical protein
MAVDEGQQPLLERVVIELSTDQDDLSALEEALDGVPGLSLHESDPADFSRHSSTWQAIVISVASAGGLKVLRDVIVTHIMSRRIKISVTRTGTKKTVIFEGHVTNSREVEQLVREITAEEPPG